jgi:hypothetical protein
VQIVTAAVPARNLGNIGGKKAKRFLFINVSSIPRNFQNFTAQKYKHLKRTASTP